MLRLSRKEEETIIEIRGSEMKQINRFTYFASMLETDGKIETILRLSVVF
jgi:hypothetical protein